ncbi:MAG: urea ABC transporter permease subunit UrtB [Burkholderiales bacterium]
MAVLLSFAVVLPVQALEADAVKGLASDDLATRIQAIDDIAAAGDEAALELLQALYNGEVYVTEDGQVVLEEDEIVDALTHEALDPEPEFYDSVIVNNRMRGNLETAIAALSLLSDDHETRMASATALEGAEDPKLLPVLKKALDKETDPEIRAMLGQTKAVIELGSADPTVRLEAAHALSDSSQRRVRELLSAKLEKTPDGEFIEPVEEVRDAAEEAMKSIDRRLLLIDYLGRFFSGLSLGSILLLVALGLAIIYGLLGVINLAHGELLMIGAYATYVTQSVFRTYFPESLDFYVVAAIPVAFIVTGGVGVVLERTVIRWLYGRPLETLLATWGISLFLIQLVRQIFGAQNVEVANPTWMSGGVEFMNVVMPYNRICIIIFSLIVLILVWAMLSRTRLGLFIRGVTQNRTMASCVGVPTGRVDLMAFGLGSGIAGLAGVALSQIGNVGPDLGQAYIIDSFMVVVLGGVGQLAGTVYAGLGLGVFSKFIEPHIGAVLTKILVLVVIIAVIQKRPQGLFALKGRAVEA